MTHEPNKAQQKLIQSHRGIYKVDAGAGTGKTYTVTLRYADILQKRDVTPQDLLLLTFTNNAAEEMKERIISKCDYSSKELRDAPISTFHSLAQKIVNEQGFNTPQILGINDNITTTTQPVSNDVLEQQEFNTFINQFIQRHPEYNDIYRTLHSYTSLLGLIKNLASKGIIPTKKDWYADTEKALDGDLETYLETITTLNKPRKSKQSKLRSKANGALDKCFDENAPIKREVRGPRGTVQADTSYFKQAFNDDREHLKQFIHDTYYEYLTYSLSHDYMNFNFLLVYAYILLREKPRVRKQYQYQYTMIDEFQDTNEVQMKIAMMISQQNICVVGDWKQSIYKFQYADVQNMTSFQQRLQTYKDQLNKDQKRITYNVENVETIHLDQNYRSTQRILNLSEKSLILPGKQKETVKIDKSNITSLQSNNYGESQIELLHSNKEEQGVLHKIQRIVKNKEYKINNRKLDYGDIAVLTRTKSFALHLQEKAREQGIPITFEGGVELFTTKPAILLLAWLRILQHKDSKKGWSVILEDTQYTLDEIKHNLKTKNYPRNIEQFRQKLRKEDRISTIAKKVFEKYGVNNGFTTKIIDVLQTTYQTTYKTKNDIITFIEQSIEQGAAHDVDNGENKNAVTLQTIHAAKGLQYPAVFIADINKRRFPSTTSNNNQIRFDETTGLRHTKKYSSKHRYVFDNWKTSLVNTVTTQDYDEERRLLYVAMTRAQNYLYLSASKSNPSTFFTKLIEKTNLEPQEPDITLRNIQIPPEKKQELHVRKPVKKAAIKKTPHTDMKIDTSGGGRGKTYGHETHRFAQRYTKENIEPQNKDQQKIKQVIDRLEGEIHTEIPIKIPDENKKGRKILWSGTIDLLHITKHTVDIIDWKTDTNKKNHKTYQQQLSVYKKGIQQIYPHKKVNTKIIYTDTTKHG